jgi:mono/diheme cytochrome c family protein
MIRIALAITLFASASAFADDSQAELGKGIYENTCSTCHGPDMVNPGTVSYDLRKFPKDGKARFVNSVMNGKGQGMPAWKDVVKPEEVEQLWAYVQTGR